ncbi:hypothetical protein P4B35_19535 [Pontiellaceae bacterium B12227]|nr:hypothetical protein [Pontiellaceae bacterium B12227]
MGAATHPGQGQVYARAMVSSIDSDEYRIHGRIVYGIVSKLALQMDGFHEWLADEPDFSTGIVRLKYRIIQKDFGPINTWRVSLAGGVEFPSDDDYAIHAAALTTLILNRHGLNGQIDWKENATLSDELMLNAAHLYRIHPARYSIHTKGAWYTELEWLNTIYDNGDYEMDLAPGLLYEARRWAAEISLRLPIAGNYYDQPNHTLAVGIRYLF